MPCESPRAAVERPVGRPTPALLPGRRTIAVAVLVALSVTAGRLAAAAPPGPFDRLNFRRIAPEAGLPAAPVFAIHQDRRGFLWFGTGDGLVRYDGSELRLFHHQPGDARSLAGDVVSAIDEDAQGDLWLATDGGLCRWARETERFFTHVPPAATKEAPAPAVTRVLVGRDGTVWATTGTGRLVRFDVRSGAFDVGEGGHGVARRSAGQVLALLEDRRGRIWLGTDAGEIERLAAGDSGATFAVPRRGDVATVQVLSLADDADGVVWAATEDGVVRLDPDRATVEKVLVDPAKPSAATSWLFDAVLVDRDGVVWAGTDGAGLFRIDRASRRFVQYLYTPGDPASLASDVVTALFEDRAGDLWVGGAPAGVSHSNRLVAGFRTHRQRSTGPKSITDNVVTAFAESPNGDLWVGTDGGLNRLEHQAEVWLTFRHDPRRSDSLAADAITSLLADSRGRLWVGVYRGGLHRYEPSTGGFVRYQPDPSRHDSISDARVWRLAEDAQGRLWVATRAGLNLFDPATGRFTRHLHDPANAATLPDDNVLCVLVARDGTVWAGTRRGLARLRADGGWDRGGDGRGGTLADTFIADLFEARDGAIWVATQGGGLHRIDPSTGETLVFRQADGLPSDQVRGVLEADDGAIWVSTNQGLARLDVQARRVRVFDAADGVQGLLFNRGARYRRRNGAFMFGGSQGFTAFEPGSIEQNTVAPPVVLTEIEVFARPLRPADGDPLLPRSITETTALRLPTRVSVLGFRFGALDFRSPERNKFAHKLEGFDTDWQPAERTGRATYTNLAAGHYRLRVRAANGDGTWNDQGVVLELDMVPPFWLTWWFKGALGSLAVVALVAGASSVATRRMRQRLKQAEAARARAVEQQQAEEELRLRERNYLEIFNSTEDAILLHEAETGRTIDANEAAVRMFGFPKAELLGKTIGDLSEGGDLFGQEQGRRHLDEAMQRGAVKVEWRSRRANGEVFASEVQLTRSSIGGANRALAVLRDISERKRLEEERLRLDRQLQHTQKLESLGVLAGGIAHDFNNLLVGILGNLDLALRDLSPAAPARESVSEAERAAQRAADLCRQMLAYSGRGQFVVESIALHELVTEMVHLLKSSISKRVSLVLALDRNVPPIRGDATQLRQIVMNLVINASEAIGDGAGTVTVANGVDTFTAEQLDRLAFGDHPAPGRYHWLQVTDTGSGMDDATRRRIFEPFFTTKFTGRGLGLSVVLGIVRGHHGALDVQSAPGRGTTFRVLFPAAEEQVLASTGAAPPDAARAFRGTALVVDDEAPVRSVGRRMLQRIGFEVLTASDGQEALEIYRARQRDISVVVLDVTMPGMDGEETLRALVAMDPSVRVVMSSGFAEQEIASRMRGLPISGFVAKPYVLTDLAARVCAALEQPRPRG